MKRIFLQYIRYTMYPVKNVHPYMAYSTYCAYDTKGSQTEVAGITSHKSQIKASDFELLPQLNIVTCLQYSILLVSISY